MILAHLDERIAEKKRYRRRLILKRVCALLLGTALAAFLVWLICFSSVFAIHSSRTHMSGVDKQSIIPVDEVRDIMRQYEGVPFVTVRRSSIESQIESIPEVAHAHVHIRFPRDLIIDLTEERPYACWGKGEGCVPLAADGSRLRIPQEQKEQLVSIIVDEGSDDPREFMQTVVPVYGNFDASLQKRITQVRIGAGGQLSFILDTGATVRWGTADDSDMKEKVLAVLLQENHTLYDVSVPSSPVTQ